MKNSDFIFEDDVNKPFELDSIIIINGEDYILTEFKDSRSVADQLGFPAVYSWYIGKLKDTDELVNLFFFDEDIDSIEKNNKVAEKWWEESYRNW